MVGNDLLMHIDGFTPKSSCSQRRWEGANVVRTSSPLQVPIGGVQPTAHEPHVAQNRYECGTTQSHKFT